MWSPASSNMINSQNMDNVAHDSIHITRSVKRFLEHTQLTHVPQTEKRYRNYERDRQWLMLLIPLVSPPVGIDGFIL